MGSLFKVLIDAAGISFALTKLILGQAVDNTLNGIAAFSFRDNNGNATMPQLNPEGAVVVTLDAGTTFRSNGKVLKASLTKNIESAIAELTLIAEKTYNRPTFIYSCYRDIQFRVALVDDADGTPIETDIYEGVLGGAEIYEDISLEFDEFNTIGGTGTQKLIFYATPIDNPDDIFVNASVNEIAS